MMTDKILDTLRLKHDKEHFDIILKNIEEGCGFRGTNLWVLFFAILVASLGLNLNSTAVVIGAMLISPLMGPIMGVGAGLAINDLPLVKRAALNYCFAAVVGLVASTIYFLLSPLDEAHSEILARTQPTVYDVLIALFGGFAAIIAVSSTQKGNVLPGAAIATALMPPLCTAGYGLATGQMSYAIGAFYLYLINSVFISAATFFTAYLLKFPRKKYSDPVFEQKAKRIVWAVIVLTLLPSIYLGYDVVNRQKFNDQANKFIDAEAVFLNNYMLRKDIDAKNRTISLTFGGEQITPEEIEKLKGILKYYGLENVTLEIKQGFSILHENVNNEQITQLGLALQQNDAQKSALSAKLDSISNQNMISQQVFKELRTQYPTLTSAVLQPVSLNVDTSATLKKVYLILLDLKKRPNRTEVSKIENLLKVRLNNNNLKVVIQ